MNTPDPVPTNKAIPSASVVTGVAIGGPAAIIVAWVLDAGLKVVMPPEVSVALGTLISGAVAYFGNGGRSFHMN